MPPDSKRAERMAGLRARQPHLAATFSRESGTLWLEKAVWRLKKQHNLYRFLMPRSHTYWSLSATWQQKEGAGVCNMENFHPRGTEHFLQGLFKSVASD